MGAENGSAKSMYNLGQNLLRGRGVEKNTQEGLQWLEKASSQGLPEAQLACGEIYFWGTDNQPRDFVKAFPYFQNAAKSDVLKAQNLLGLCYRDGFGTSTDHQLAEEWFRRAAERNDPKAQSNLAHLLGVTSAGLDQSPKKVEALKWLIISSNQKEITAVKSLNVIRPTLDPKLLAAGEKAASDFEMQQSLSENR